MIDLNKIEIVTTETELRRATDAAFSSRLVGVDIETTGLNPRMGRIRLIQMALPDGTTFVVDAFKFNLDQLLGLAWVMASPEIVKVSHNAKFEVSWLSHHLMAPHSGTDDGEWDDFYPESFYCTSLASQVIAAGIRMPHKLEAVAPRWLGEDARLDKTLQKSDWSGELSREQIEYAAMDAMVMLPLRERLTREMARLDLLRVAKIEFDALIPIAHAELFGIHLDKDMWSALLTEKIARQESRATNLRELLQPGVDWEMRNPSRGKRPVKPKKPLKREYIENPELLSKWELEQSEWTKRFEAWDAIPKEVGAIINLNSPSQIQRAMNSLGLHLEETNENYINKIAARLEGSQRILIEALMDYREAAKSVSAFGQSFLDAIEEDGRIHPEFKQIGAEGTGRMSCGGSGVEDVSINAQQVPKDRAHRSCFTAPDGRRLVIADYGQMELRLLAEYSGDRAFVDAFTRKLDPFKASAVAIYGVRYEDVTDEMRGLMKRIDYGICYGIGAGKIAYGAGIPFEEARGTLNAWHGKHDGASNWLARAAKQAQDHGFTRTPWGRLIRYEYDRNDKGQWAAVGRNGTNAPVQGGNADITKRALALLWDKIKGSGVEIVNIVHDEIVLDSPKNSAEWAAHALEKSMREAAEEVIRRVPVAVDAIIADAWLK